MKESVIENYLVERMKSIGAEIRKVKWIGRRGAPDRCVMHKGLTVWIELKAPNEEAQAHQVREHERMQRAGQTVLIIDSLEKVDQFFEMFKKSSNEFPECGRGMLLFSSHKEKICTDCNLPFDWNLNPGQRPLVQYQR